MRDVTQAHIDGTKTSPVFVIPGLFLVPEKLDFHADSAHAAAYGRNGPDLKPVDAESAHHREKRIFLRLCEQVVQCPHHHVAGHAHMTVKI